MAIREIITVPHPTLKRKARPVSEFGQELQTIIDDMFETLRDAPGVGLAAPQINVSLQVVVGEFCDEEDETKPPDQYILINPEITRESQERIVDVEGCLSVPGLLGDVERAESITIKFMNRYGHPKKLKTSGWLARIFQHEIDHLNGILYTDRAENVWVPQPGEEEVIH